MKRHSCDNDRSLWCLADLWLNLRIKREGDRHEDGFREFQKKTAAEASVSLGALAEQSTKVGDQRIAFLQSGPLDKTIVFIHGNSACKEAFVEQFNVLQESGFGVLALDLPGHGASADAQNPTTQYTIPSYAKLIASLCAQLEINNPLLCGWSLGGHIAIEMAAESTEYSGLMIFGTPPVGPGIENIETAFLASNLSDVTGAENPPRDRLETYISELYGTLQRVPEILVTAGLRADGRSRSTMSAHWASGSNGHDQRTLVQGWRGPILMLHGIDDPFISGDYFKSLDVPGDGSGPTFKVIEDVGHAPFIEAPDFFNAHLLELCKRCFK